MINDLLCDLSACLCAALTPEGAAGPDLCFCGVVPGQQVALDHGECERGCGMAWTRLVTAYPASGLAVPFDPTISGGCGLLLGVTIEIGVIRCINLPDDGIPEAAELERATRQQMEDMLAMRRAVLCCGLETGDYALSNYQPYGPEGIIVGGWWTLDAVI